MKRDTSSQTTLSSFFSQKPSSPMKRKVTTSSIDSASDERPLVKKKKSSGENIIQTSLSPKEDSRATVSESHSTVADKWRYNISSPEKLEQEMTPADKNARQLRHEAFRKKLLQENSLFIRRKSDANEARDVIEDDSGGETAETETSEDELDRAFKHLQDMFSQKSLKGKAKSKVRRVRAAPIAPSTGKGKKKVVELGPSGKTYTPLENQVVRLKADNPGVLLMIEVGYKYRFFGEDAKIATKELGMVSFSDRNFLVASIPTHRRDVHLKKLLSQGYKVGIVEQIETAALKKVSENRNAPFERKLTHLYTATTFVEDMDSIDDLERYSPPPLMCLIEEQNVGSTIDGQVCIAMITICPSTGDVVWDEFDDTHMRIELETRMVHTRPAELLLPEGGLTKLSERMLSHFSGVRIERFKGLMSYTEAFSFVSEFYTDKTKSAMASAGFASGELMAAVTDFPKRVVMVLAHAIKHLSAFSIADAFLETKFFNKFTTKVHMLLNGNTSTNLEIYRNETDNTARGSLMWILDHTKTKFGARLLKNWVGRPLIDVSVLQDRIDAVEEILESQSEKLVVLRELLKKLPDLAKGLCRIQYGKCTPQELAVILSAFDKIAKAYTPIANPSDIGFKSKVLNDIIYTLPKLKEPMKQLLSIISLKRAAEGRKDTMWNDSDTYPAIADADLAIQMIEVELLEELTSIRKLLRMPSLKYTTVLGDEYLIELKKSENRTVPPTWLLSSRTKYLERYYTPAVKEKVQERAQSKETLAAEAHKAFLHFLDQIIQNHYVIMREVVNKLAIADCLLSFALVALRDGYVRPVFTEDDILEIVEGRHPMVEALRTDPFVPNSVNIGGAAPRSKIITGPNMGGKSSSVRMIALIAIMAQIGCYVPASSVKLGMLDSVLTRMGASDDLARGRSTFMVEMTETSDILRMATSRSLVILDELGRGTSTFDGMAIASATLQHLVRTIRCKTLFITHYPLVATELERKFPTDIQNLHMGYREEAQIDGTRDITFLYHLTPGLAADSFGVECARLAGLPESILGVATRRSQSLRSTVEERMRRNKARKCILLLHQCLAGSSPEKVIALGELQTMLQSMFIFNPPIRNI